MNLFAASRISPTLARTEFDTLVKLLTMHFALPLEYPLAGACFEVMFASAVSGTRETRKLLFDVLRDGIGWSLKTHSVKSSGGIALGSSFEVVIQRCDILRNRSLTLESPPQALGDAAVEHFNKWALKSRDNQSIVDPRAGFLLRDKAESRFVFFQHRFRLYEPCEVEWRWANDDRKSLMGYAGGGLVFRWYRSGTQLFGEYQIPGVAHEFEITGQRVGLDAALDFFASQGISAETH